MSLFARDAFETLYVAMAVAGLTLFGLIWFLIVRSWRRSGLTPPGAHGPRLRP